MVDISTIPTAELEKDLQDSRNDISVCEVALSMGVQSYSGGAVKKRLDGNRHFVEVITAELGRRAAVKEAGEQQATHPCSVEDSGLRQMSDGTSA